jgi:protoheme IX farnesyltransferase
MKTEIDNRGTLTLERLRAFDYLVLTKPELTFLSVLTALAGYALGVKSEFHGSVVLHLLAGTAFVGGGAGALNQVMERSYDFLMKRTERRPIPSGRLSPLEGRIFGILLTAGGILELAMFVNALTALLATLTSVTYLFLYTPLKRITPFSTVVGGIPGALPPVMGWAAARNEISLAGCAVLFGILFLWQMPHFLSLAWLYRKDYERAGYRLLTVMDAEGRRTSFHTLTSTILLVPVTLLLAPAVNLGPVYVAGALVLGLSFLALAGRLYVRRSASDARAVFFASLLYLPGLMAAMVVDRLLL